MKKTALIFLLGITMINTVSAQPGVKKNASQKESYFVHTFKIGEEFGTVFSRTIAITGSEFQPLVFRISGTGNYKVIETAGNQPDFDAVFLYDGRPEDHSKTGIRDFGKTLMYNRKLSENTDASGLTYNALLWGTPPEKLKTGDSWEVFIAQPWELGGAGHQRVEVVESDPLTQMIRLKREGDGEGSFADDKTETEIVSKGQRFRVKIVPGKNHWVGYTTFKNGIIISDELLVTRPLTLTHNTQQFTASQRQYILLNQMPN